MGGRASRQKGNRREREIVQLHKGLGLAGVDAERIPLSGAAGGTFTGDVRLSLPCGEMRAEVKGRANGEGFVTLERWMGGNDALFLRRDRAAPLVLLPWATWERLLRASAAPANDEPAPADPAGKAAA